MTAALLSEVERGGRGVTARFGAVSLSPEEVGQRIESARKEKRWTRLDLATAMDVSPSSINRWEGGKLPSSVYELMRLAEVLDKPSDYLTEPPERQVELVHLRDRLEGLEESVAASREAALEILASIHDQLVRIEERLDPPDAQASR